MKIKKKQPEPKVDATQKREKLRTTAIGIVVGGVIGITLGMIVASFFRDSERQSQPEAPIPALPPRPAAATATK